jgi:hypothetical protein
MLSIGSKDLQEASRGLGRLARCSTGRSGRWWESNLGTRIRANKSAQGCSIAHAELEVSSMVGAHTGEVDVSDSTRN